VQWLEHLDTLLGKYSHIVAALEAFGTLAAVITSLALARLAQRANRTKLQATAFIGQIVPAATAQPPPRYLTIVITNTGLFQLRIPYAFFSFKIPLRRALMAVLPLDASGDNYLPKRTYPVCLQPRTTEWFSVITEQKLNQAFAETWKDEPKWRKPLFRFMRAVVVTEDGTRCRVKLSKDIVKYVSAST
jgi:hypothetical protein